MYKVKLPEKTFEGTCQVRKLFDQEEIGLQGAGGESTLPDICHDLLNDLEINRYFVFID